MMGVRVYVGGWREGVVVMACKNTPQSNIQPKNSTKSQTLKLTMGGFANVLGDDVGEGSQLGGIEKRPVLVFHVGV